jgi:hypothetical protein
MQRMVSASLLDRDHQPAMQMMVGASLVDREQQRQPKRWKSIE